jgi:hypothetical protein
MISKSTWKQGPACTNEVVVGPLEGGYPKCNTKILPFIQLHVLEDVLHLLKLLECFNREWEIKQTSDRANWGSIYEGNIRLLAKEYSSGYSSLSSYPFQQSSQRRQVDPSNTVTEANLLNLSSNFKMSFHQKDPFFVWLGSLSLL